MCHHDGMRRWLAWPISVPLAVIGTLAGHSAGYRVAVPDVHERAQVLASSGHGYLGYAPLVIAVCVAVAVLAFVATVLAAVRGREPETGKRRLTLIAALAPVAFVLQELIERYAHDGRMHWELLVSAPFLVGLALQLPFALLAAAIAFALAITARRIATAIAARRRHAAESRERQPVLAARRPSAPAGPRPRLRRARPSPAPLAEQRAADLAAERSEERCRTIRAVVRAGRCSSRSPQCWRRSRCAPAAGAHARLLTTEPANDAVLEQSPRFVLLRFDEPIETAFGAIRVYDARAHRVDAGDVEQPSETEARIGVDRRLARGTYTATWRVVSADGHPVSGAFVFHVGAPGANPAGIAAQVLEGGTPRSVSVPFSVVRALDFLLLLVVGGGTLMLTLGLGAASAGDPLQAVAAARGRRVPAGAGGGRRDPAPGSGRRRLRPPRGAPPRRRLGGARHEVRQGLAPASGARGRVCSGAPRRRARARARPSRVAAGRPVARHAFALRARECLGRDRRGR